MNVLYLTNNAGRASTTVATNGWFENLGAKGLHPVLVSPIVGEFFDWSVNRGIPAYQLNLPFPNKKYPFPFLRSLWHLRRIVRQHRIELIHCNEQDIYPIGRYLARVCKLPLVVSVHFTMARKYCHWAFAGKKSPQRMFFLSRGSREACRPGVEGIVPEERWRLLSNGLDPNSFLPDKVRREEFRRNILNDSDVAIGVACAIRPRKQLEHLMEAASRINDERVKVVVAGGPVEGDEEYARDLFSNAQMRLGSRLILLGHLNELRGFYNGIDIFLNTSQEEACSISVIESLACGCPVLGYASKSVDDQILPDGGEIVSQDNIDELTVALNRWIMDRTELTARRVRARNRAEHAFDILKLSNQLWGEYEDVLSEWNRQLPKKALKG